MGNCLNKWSTRSESDDEDEENSSGGSSSSGSDESTLIQTHHATGSALQNQAVSSSSSNHSHLAIPSTQRSAASHRGRNHRSGGGGGRSRRSTAGQSDASRINNAFSSSLTSLSTSNSINTNFLLGHASAASARSNLSPSMNNMYCCSSLYNNHHVGSSPVWINEMSEEDQLKYLKRSTLIEQLPTGSYSSNKKNKECVICMVDFEQDDKVKYLPCMHMFHQSCIDAWLLKAMLCPSCMEPVDTGLLAAYT